MSEQRQAWQDRQDYLAFFVSKQRAARFVGPMAFAMVDALIKSNNNGAVEQRIALNVRQMR